MSIHVFYPSSFPVDPETSSVTRSKVQHYLNEKDGFVLTGGGCFRGATGGGLARGVVLMVIGGASVPVGVVGGLLTVDRLLSFSRTGNGGGVSSDSGSIVEGVTFLYGGLPGEKDKRPPGGSDLLVLTGRGGGEGERSFTFEVSPFVTSEEGGIVSGGTAAGLLKSYTPGCRRPRPWLLLHLFTFRACWPGRVTARAEVGTSMAGCRAG